MWSIAGRSRLEQSFPGIAPWQPELEELDAGVPSHGWQFFAASSTNCCEGVSRIGSSCVFECIRRDLELPVAQHDGRLLEVVADWLPLFGGAQLAIDTTVQMDSRVVDVPLRTEHHSFKPIAGPLGPPGFHMRTRGPQTHISAPRRFKHHQNTTKTPPEREEKNENVGGRTKKKREILAPLPFGPPSLRAPTPAGPPAPPQRTPTTPQCGLAK